VLDCGRMSGREMSGWRLTLGMRDRAAPLLPDEVGQTIVNVVPDFLGVASLSRCNDFRPVGADRERAKHECDCVFEDSPAPAVSTR
jgi:hypothetical protein